MRCRACLDDAVVTGGLRGRGGAPLREQCENFVTTPEFVPALETQLADVRALHDDATERGWDSEIARHARVIASIEGHLRRLKEVG